MDDEPESERRSMQMLTLVAVAILYFVFGYAARAALGAMGWV